MLETGRDVIDMLLRSMALASMVLAGACDRRHPGPPIVPTAPTVPAVPTVTLSGTVVERFSGQPIQGALVGLAVGDALSADGWPQVDWWTGGWIGGLIGGVQRIQTIANKDTKIVTGRGGVLNYNDIAAQVDMYGTIYDRLNQMINKGRGPSEAVEAKVAKEYEAKMGNADEFVRRSAESLWAYLSPDA